MEDESYRRWEKLELLGRGATGVVYKVFLNDDGLTLAAKQVEVPRNLSSSQRGQVALLSAMGELKVMKGLPQHDHIVRLYGYQLEEEVDTRGMQHLTIFMELAVGGSLASLVKRVGPLEEGVVRQFTKQIASGLTFLHSNGVVHRDIKGGNVLLAGVSGDRLQLADFGSAVALITTQGGVMQGGGVEPGGASAPTTAPSSSSSYCCIPWGSPPAAFPPGQASSPVSPPAPEPSPFPASPTVENVKQKLVGTPQYMAPEVIAQTPGDGKPGDVWALGCTVIEMITGQVPWGEWDRKGREARA